MNWQDFFFTLSKTISKKSKDISTKVGCVIVNDANDVISIGYNGFPRGVKDDNKKNRDRYERPLKYKFTSHAEENAIATAAKNGYKLLDCTIYIDWPPCSSCARMIIQSGIKTIIINTNSELYNNNELQKRWKEDQDISKTMLLEAGIEIHLYGRKDV